MSDPRENAKKDGNKKTRSRRQNWLLGWRGSVTS